jgi:hypothetical protein
MTATSASAVVSDGTTMNAFPAKMNNGTQADALVRETSTAAARREVDRIEILERRGR